MPALHSVGVLDLFLQTMCLGNGERIIANAVAVKLLFETGEVEQSSPGILADCVSSILLLVSYSLPLLYRP